MKENKLAGTAAWALGQESSDIWDLILKYVNQSDERSESEIAFWSFFF